MAKLGSRHDNEQASYTLDPNGNVARRITGDLGFTPSGLKAGGKVTKQTLNSTSWTALPASALVDRNALSVQNISSVDILLNHSNTAPLNEGMRVYAGGERAYDVTDHTIIYAVLTAGLPQDVMVEELA